MGDLFASGSLQERLRLIRGSRADHMEVTHLSIDQARAERSWAT